MQEENQHNDKKFQIIQEYHRTKPKQKIYKIRISMVGIMHKAEQKLRMKFERQPNQSYSNSHMEPRSSNSLDDDIFDQMTNEEIIQQPNGPQRSSSQQKPIKIYEDFTNRGKYDNLKFHFCKQKQRITIIISASYFFNQLKLKEFDMLMVYQSFTKIWLQEYIQIMQTFIKYWKQFKNHDNIKFEFVAIDIIGVTFEIAYSNKVNEKNTELKRFRFRYSPFEFRQNPLFEEKSTQQIISYVEIHSNSSANIVYQDFYSSMRLGFIDDINNNSSDLWRRMIMRFWVFYQLHCLNRGISDFQQFNKKALGRVHLNPIRMKKFQLIFPFPLLNKNIIDEGKQGVIYFTFYLDEKEVAIGQNGLEFKINVNIVEHYDILTFEQKKQIYRRLSKEESFNLTERPNLAPNELFQFWMTLKFDDKISKAFAKLQTIVSFFIDKISFNQLRNHRLQHQQSDNQKIISIARQLEPYDESKNVDYGQKAGQFIHFHTLVLQLKHKHSVLSTYPNTNIPRICDETTFYRIYKQKRKYNTTNPKKEQQIEIADLTINEDLKKYLNQILKIKPLRECYKEVLNYIEKVVKITYMPFKDSNDVKIIPNKQMTLSLIITNICKLLELGNHHSRKSQISIITDKDPLLVREVNEEDLVAEITFNIKDLKIYWIKRLPEGYIIVRMFERRIEIVKDLNFRTSIDINFGNIEQTSEDLLKQLKNILMKEFATLQNMMI